MRDKNHNKRIAVPVQSNDIYMGAIPWVIMQVILVFVVIFVPQSVTMFLDKEIKVDIDKVKIEIQAPNSVSPALSAAEEQKKMEDLFKDAAKK